MAISNPLSILKVIPFFKSVDEITKNPMNIQKVIKSNPEIGVHSKKLLDLAMNKPSDTLKQYSQKIDNTYITVKQTLGEEKFLQKNVLSKTVLDTTQYSTYLTYRLIKDLHLKPAASVITSIMCTSVGTFWKIITFGRYQLTKELADKLIDRIARRGLTLQTFLTLATIVFQVGLIFLIQIATTIASLYFLIKYKSIMKGLASLLYIFIVSIVALVMLAKTGYAAGEGVELSKKNAEGA